ncbi:MAG TPA: fumarylacetoacetate hydrolase family protein [Burkholderiales bacterium]|jgi:2-keto-4-pentenoate hydratase|nr:fumarylacetoacetate hydrolase family protein [Burkholderiales bacterium]
MSAPIERIAALFAAAHRTRRPLAIPDDVLLDSPEDAYRLQDAVFAQLWPGKPPAAWKVGSPGEGVEPTGAPIASVHASPARLASAGRSMIGIEAEIAFRVGRDVAMSKDPPTQSDLAASVIEALVTIEICDTRLADWKNASPLWKLADFQSNSALVTGSGTRAWREIDFAVQAVELRIGARTIAARGAHPWGDPFRLLPWAAAHCVRRSSPLRAGDLVTTGSWTGMEFAQPGEEIVARFPGIGEARVRFDAA